MPEEFHQPNATRREVLAATAAAVFAAPLIAWLEQVPGGILAPDFAYADENNYTIQVLSPKQVGFYVVDVSADSTGTSKKTPIAGAKITITSLNNQKTLTGTTDEKGGVILDISALALMDKSGNPVDDKYACNVTLKVEASGYRNFETHRLTITGGTGAMVPTQPLTSTPYLEKASFDGWDICYTQASFLCAYTNSGSHTISVNVANCAATAAVSATFLAVDSAGKYPTRTLGTATATYDAQAMVFKAECSGAFLHEGSGTEIPAGWTCQVAVAVGGTSYTFNTYLVSKNPPDESALSGTSSYNSQLTAIPFFDTSGWGGLSFPFGIKLQLFEGLIPVQIKVNPWGSALVMLNSPSWGYTKDFEDDKKSGTWTDSPYESPLKKAGPQRQKNTRRPSIRHGLKMAWASSRLKVPVRKIRGSESWT